MRKTTRSLRRLNIGYRRYNASCYNTENNLILIVEETALNRRTHYTGSVIYNNNEMGLA